jgi:roadblock/LC7 domain-containing protein
MYYTGVGDAKSFAGDDKILSYGGSINKKLSRFLALMRD